MHQNMKIAVVGGTGVAGKELLSILIQAQTPIENISVFASKNSAGSTINIEGYDVFVHTLEPKQLADFNIVFLAAGSAISRQIIEDHGIRGPIFIDKSSAFRMDEGVPLILAGTNDNALTRFDDRQIIASPNCAMTPFVPVLSSLLQFTSINHVDAVCLQSVSGAGKTGIDVLEQETRGLFTFKEPEENELFDRRIAFNLIPMIPTHGAMISDHTEEEWKVIDETHKILERSDFTISPTCIRTPTFHGHAASVTVHLKDDVSPDELRRALEQLNYVQLIDDPKQFQYPTHLDAIGEDDIFVGRIRNHPQSKKIISFYAVSDNLRIGAALNAYRIYDLIQQKIKSH